MLEKIIERLEAETRLPTDFYGWGYNDGIADAIKIVKEVATDINVGNKNGWIPCSERVPNYEEAWYHNEEDDIYEPNEFIVMIKGAEIPTVLFYDTAFEEWTDGCDNVYEVIAW